MIPLNLLAGGIGVVAILGAIHLTLYHAKQEGVEQCRAGYAKAAAEAAARQRAEDIARQFRNQGITDAHRQRLQADAPDRSAVDRRVAGVRNAATALGDRAASAATPGAGTDDTAARLAALLAEGAGLAAEGRSRTRTLESQVIGLQDYAASVCGAKD